MDDNKNIQQNTGDEPKEDLTNWNRRYMLVFFNLVFLIVLFYIFTKVFE